jgi:outer membrane protein TolC
MPNKILISLTTIFISLQVHALTIEDYLNQVESKGEQYKAAEENLKAATAEAELYKKYTSALFYSEARWVDDKKETANPDFQGTRTDNTNLAFGIKHKTIIGLDYDLSYNLGHTKIYDASLVAIPEPDYYETYPQLKLSLPLWKNFFGTQVRAQKESARSGLAAGQIEADIGMQKARIDTVLAFYSLNYYRELQGIYKDNLERANKLLSWSRSRIQKNLTEDSDYFQSKSNYSLRELDLQNAELKLSQAAREFNFRRGHSGSDVKEKLVVKEVNVDRLSLPLQPFRMRKDLRAQQLAAESQKHSYLDKIEETKPGLDVVLVTSLNGRDIDKSSASSEWQDDPKKYYMVALQFTMPVDLGLMSRLRAGAHQKVESERLKTTFLQDHSRNSWQDFVETGERIKTQLRLLAELEAIQKKKADTERIRLRQGRSSTFQVLNFEQDYINARAQRAAVELEARAFIEQIKLYE